MMGTIQGGPKDRQCLSPPPPTLKLIQNPVWGGWKKNQVPVIFPLVQWLLPNPSSVSSMETSYTEATPSR